MKRLAGLALVPAFMAAWWVFGWYEPTRRYERREIHGFTVLVSSKLGGEERETAIAELTTQLEQVRVVLPPHALATVREARIWLERNIRPHSAWYHGKTASKRFLRTHGYNPDKAGGFEITNARLFVEWSRKDQPTMALHELSHAYDDRRPDVMVAVDAAYASAKARGLYAEDSYAMKNADEYFAELSEAYFGRNDIFPYVRDELRTHDLDGFMAIEAAWK